MADNNNYPMVDQKLITGPEVVRQGVLPEEVGQSALNVLHGQLIDIKDPNEATRNLGSKIRTYRKMQADPTIGGALQGYENILSLVSWDTAQAEYEKSGISKEDFDESKAKESRDFVQSCFDDMSTSVEDKISASLDMLSIGFQVTVPQFKVRAGYTDDPRFRSKHNDGKIGWKSWKTIHQESIDRWLIEDGDGYEDLTGLRQRLVNGGYKTIPRNRMLLFRTTAKGGNMEGESILYSAVSTWQSLQKTLKIEDVALSRNLEGIPVLKLPSRYLSANATTEEKKLVNYLILQVKSIKFNEQSAIVLPSDVDPDSKVPMISIELMTAGPNVRVDQCRGVNLAKEQLMAESILANFMKLGSGGGSYAMSSSMQDMFVLAMKKYLDNISNVINNEAIPLLLRANGMDERYAPRLVHEGLDTDSIGVFVDALVKCVQSGVVVPTKGLQRTVLTKMRASTVEADAAWEKTEELQDKLIEATERQAEAELKNTQAPAPSAADSGPTGKTKQQSLQKSKEMEYVTIEGSEYLLREGVLFQIEEN
jgi:hypothetical protein